MTHPEGGGGREKKRRLANRQRYTERQKHTERQG